jgi:hypothetical protein
MAKPPRKSQRHTEPMTREIVFGVGLPPPDANWTEDDQTETFRRGIVVMQELMRVMKGPNSGKDVLVVLACAIRTAVCDDRIKRGSKRNLIVVP